MHSITRDRLKIVTLSCLFVLLGTFSGHFFLGASDRLSFALFDAFQKQTPLKFQSEVALVTVEQQSIDRLEQEDMVPPYPREFYGVLAKVAAHYSVPLIVYDILFTESSRFGVEDDLRFARNLKESGVPAFFPAASPSGLTKAPVPQIAQVAAGLGSVNSENDSDGVFRKFLAGNSMANEVLKRLRPDSKENSRLEYFRYYTKESFPVQSVYNVVSLGVDAKYNQDQEYEADEAALLIPQRAGYVPVSLHNVLSRIPDSSTFFGSHPRNEKRNTAILQISKGMRTSGSKLSTARFLKFTR